MNPYLMVSLELSPLAIGRIVRHIPSERHDQLSDPERFSLREAVAHLADWEPILRQRIMTGVETPGASIMGLDEGQRAIEMGYKSLDPYEQLDLFAERRGQTLAYLRGLQPEDWHKSIVHNERGEMTVADQANMLLGHDLYHIEHLTQML